MFNRFRLKRQIALTLIVTMVMQFVYAGVAYALSEGPAQPEAMQFEPVTTTDLVNLQSGDFSYSLPLMEVPGPEGGYPISMSYHAGIGTNQEATSTGLGWNINPGSINRVINGYPDDFNGYNVETHYESSEISGSGINLSLGYGPVGLNMNFDSNRGFGIVGLTLSMSMYGVGVSASISAGGIGFNVSMAYNGIGLSAGTGGINASIGIDAGGGATIGISAGTQGISAGVSYGAIGFSINNHHDINVNAGPLYFSLYKNGENSASIAGINLTGGGMSSMTTAGEGTTKSYQSPTVNPLLPLSFLGINFGISRYEWSWKLDQNSTEKSFGFINQQNYYASNEPSKKYERQLQGDIIYPAQDIYMASSQTVSGTFQPFMKQAYLLLDKENNNEKAILKNVETENNFGPYSTNNYSIYRFLGDPGANYATLDNGTELPGVNGWGEDYQNIFSSQFSEHHSSRRIDPIIVNSKLEGFRIFDTDGKVYEFKQPVYNYLFHSYSYTASSPGIESYTNFTEPYASDWLLTTILGPDYVDNDWSEDPSAPDYGYWIKFIYTVNPNKQVWRSPYSGNSPGGSSQLVSSFSMGLRDQVYLSRIESATHSAEFYYTTTNNKNLVPSEVGSITFKSVNNLYYCRSHQIKGNWTDFINTVINNGVYDDQRIFTAKAEYGNDVQGWYHYDFTIFGNQIQSCTYDINSNITTINETGTPLTLPNYVNVPFYNYREAPVFYFGEIIVSEFASTAKQLNKISLYKINNTNNSDLIKSVSFSYDNSLCRYTPNSTGNNQGKLTLTKVEFRGNDDELIMPPYEFEYGNDDPYGSGLNPDYNAEDWDRWGSYRDPNGGSDRDHFKHLTPQDKSRADKSAAWSLTKIISPSGGETIIEHESDDYYYVDDRLDFLYLNLNPIVGEPRGTRSYVVFNSGIPQTIVKGEKIYYCQVVHAYGQTGYYTDFATVEEINYSTGRVDFDSDFYFTENQQNVTFEFFIVTTNPVIYGGGIRTKSITSSDGINIYKTLYNYKNALGFSSGVTASLPPQYNYFSMGVIPGNANTELNDSYKLKYLDHEYSIGRPAPSVMYSSVEVMNVSPDTDTPISGKTVYEFYTAKDYPYYFNKNSTSHLIDIVDRSTIYGSPKKTTYYQQYNDGGVKFRKVKADEYNYTFGDELNNSTNVIKCVNEQTSVISGDSKLGVTQEKYKFRQESSDPNHNTHYFVDKRQINSYLIGSIAKEYFYNSETGSQPNDSLTITSKFFTFDALTGCAIATATQDSRNDYTNITRKIPAYWKYDDMRSYENQISNIFQTTQYYSNVGINTNWKNYDFGQHSADIVSSEITTWVNASNNSIGWTWGWKINDTYRYDNSLPYQEFPNNMLDNLDESYPDVTSSFPWLKTSNITEYDRFSHPVEESMIDGSYITAQYNYDESLPEAIIKGARKNVDQIGREASYIGFERANNQPGFFFGEEDSWTLDPVNYYSSDKHTGKYSYQVIGGSSVDGPKREFLPPTLDSQKRKYKFSFWVKTEAGFTNGSLILHTKQNNNNNTVYPTGISQANIVKQITDTQGKWVYMEGIIDLAKIRELGAIPDATSLRIRCLPQNNNSKYMLIDDIRFRPVDATMATYTYDPVSWNVTSITDNNDITTYYEYDTAGRLVCVRDQDYKIIKTYSYQYGKSF